MPRLKIDSSKDEQGGLGGATVGEEARCGWDGGAARQEPVLTLDGRRLAAGRGKLAGQSARVVHLGKDGGLAGGKVKRWGRVSSDGGWELTLLAFFRVIAGTVRKQRRCRLGRASAGWT